MSTVPSTIPIDQRPAVRALLDVLFSRGPLSDRQYQALRAILESLAVVAAMLDEDEQTPTYASGSDLAAHYRLGMTGAAVRTLRREVDALDASSPPTAPETTPATTAA